MSELVHNKMFEYIQDSSLVIKYLQIEPTNICNADCFFCIRKEKKQKPKNMTLDELKVITTAFPDVTFIKMQGLGECFFTPDLDILLKHLHEVYPDAVIMSSTNLNSNKNEEELSRILEYLDILYLSIDGGTAETYEKIRTGCKWDKMWETLKKLSQFKKEHNNFVVSFTASNLNVHELGPLVDQLQEYPIDELRINPVQDWSSDNHLVFPENYTDSKYIEELRKWDKVLKRGNLNIIVVGNEEFHYNTCIWPFERMYIDVYGNVFLCVISLDDKWCQGNVFEQDPQGIYNNSTVKEIRSCLKENKAHEHCKTCSYKFLVPSLKQIRGK